MENVDLVGMVKMAAMMDNMSSILGLIITKIG